MAPTDRDWPIQSRSARLRVKLLQSVIPDGAKRPEGRFAKSRNLAFANSKNAQVSYSIVSCATNVWRQRKLAEKLRYIPSEPGEAGTSRIAGTVGMEQSSSVCTRVRGPVRVNFQEWKSTIKMKKREMFGEASAAS